MCSPETVWLFSGVCGRYVLSDGPTDAGEEVGLGGAEAAFGLYAAREAALQGELQVGVGKVTHFEVAAEGFAPVAAAEACTQHQSVGGQPAGIE